LGFDAVRANVPVLHHQLIPQAARGEPDQADRGRNEGPNGSAVVRLMRRPRRTWRGAGKVPAETVVPASSTIGSGRAALRALLPVLAQAGAGERLTLFCNSDLVAFGALVEAPANGVAVPGRLAVCGFSDFELSATSDPPLTTVSVEGARIGWCAYSFVLDRLGGVEEARRVQVPSRIIERASS